jgi:predicted XRE-type DNA-binding protein
MKTQQFAHAWDGQSMKLRSEVMIALNGHIDYFGMTQAEAAKALGVSQPRISDLQRGKIHLFGFDSLVRMATAAGFRIELQIVKEP